MRFNVFSPCKVFEDYYVTTAFSDASKKLDIGVLFQYPQKDKSIPDIGKTARKNGLARSP